jgi:hypothetical protein
MPNPAERFRKARDRMTMTTFARRRRKAAVLRQNIDNLYPILNPMDNILKHWKTSLAGLVGIAAIIVSTWLPEYQVEMDKAIVVLMGLGLLQARDPKGPPTGPLSGYISKLIIIGFAATFLSSCQNGQFMGLDSKGWTNVLVDGGKTLGKQAPGVFLQAYAAEQNRPKTSAKQPIDVQPIVITPEPAPSPTQNFLTRWF